MRVFPDDTQQQNQIKTEMLPAEQGMFVHDKLSEAIQAEHSPKVLLVQSAPKRENSDSPPKLKSDKSNSLSSVVDSLDSLDGTVR